MKRTVQAQKIGAAIEILELVEAKIPVAHLGQTEKDLLAKAKEQPFSM